MGQTAGNKKKSKNKQPPPFTASALHGAAWRSDPRQPQTTAPGEKEREGGKKDEREGGRAGGKGRGDAGRAPHTSERKKNAQRQQDARTHTRTHAFFVCVKQEREANTASFVRRKRRGRGE